MSGQIFVITGPSGVGKGTICEALLKRHSTLTLSVSATSRTPRAHEQNGVDYHFRNRLEFEAMIEHDRAEPDPAKHFLLEWAEYNGHYYGTPRKSVETCLKSGRHVLLEIETQGALMVKEKFSQACLIFILPPDLAALETRLRGRGTDSDEDIARRLRIAEREIALQDRFDFVFTNHELDVCLAEIEALVTSRMGLGSGATVRAPQK